MIRRLLLILLFIALGVAALGYYRGWFSVTTDGSGSQHRISLTVDEDKIKADEKRAREQLPAGPATKNQPAKTVDADKN